METVSQAWELCHPTPQTIAQVSNKLPTKDFTAINTTSKTNLILASLWHSSASAISSVTLEIQPISPLKASFLRSINEEP